MLFYELSLPLMRVIDELGEVPDPTLVLTPIFKLDELSTNPGVAEILKKAHSVGMTISFNTIPEALFERLALRFRPFYLQGERTNFLVILNLLKAKNPEIRPALDDLKRRWLNAVFWERMGLHLPGRALEVSAERIIKCGFYSKFFHANEETRKEAAQYEQALGSDQFWMALVSAVWQRAIIVTGFAKSLRSLLLVQQLVSEEGMSDVEKRDNYPKTPIVEMKLDGKTREVRELGAEPSQRE